MLWIEELLFLVWKSWGLSQCHRYIKFSWTFHYYETRENCSSWLFKCFLDFFAPFFKPRTSKLALRFFFFFIRWTTSFLCLTATCLTRRRGRTSKKRASTRRQPRRSSGSRRRSFRPSARRPPTSSSQGQFAPQKCTERWAGGVGGHTIQEFLKVIKKCYGKSLEKEQQNALYEKNPYFCHSGSVFCLGTGFISALPSGSGGRWVRRCPVGAVALFAPPLPLPTGHASATTY